MPNSSDSARGTMPVSLYSSTKDTAPISGGNAIGSTANTDSTRRPGKSKRCISTASSVPMTPQHTTEASEVSTDSTSACPDAPPNRLP